MILGVIGPLGSSLAAALAALLMVRAGLGKKMLDWRGSKPTRGPRKRRPRDH